MGVSIDISYAQAMPSVTVHFLLPVDQDAELSVPSPVTCLPTCYHVSCHEYNGLNL